MTIVYFIYHLTIYYINESVVIKDMIYVGMHIADVHINPNNYERIINELREVFLERVKNYKVLHYITFCGDLFDYEMSLNSPAVIKLILFMDDLVKECIKKNIKLRILRGTRFHDAVNQLRVFLKYESYEDLDFKIIEEVNSEYLYDDLKVLYIPEEYVKDQDEYYRKYFNKEYDLAFGHGMFKEVSFESKKQESGVTMSKSPVFDSKDLISIVKGFVAFGHIHTPAFIKDKIQYVGSFSRLCFGEEHNKGFFISTYDTKDSSYYLEQVSNTLAPEYNTYVIKKLDIEDIESILKKISEKFTEGNYYRIVANFNNDSDREKLNLEILNRYFSKDKNVKVIVKNTGILKLRDENKKALEERVEVYNFLFDEGVPLEEKLGRYIKMKYDHNIELDKIKSYLDM